MTRVSKKSHNPARAGVSSQRRDELMSPVMQESPLWASPAVWGVGLVGAGLLGVPIYCDSQNLRLITAFYADISLSNQNYKTPLQHLCSDRLNHMISGDIRIDGIYSHSWRLP